MTFVDEILATLRANPSRLAVAEMHGRRAKRTDGRTLVDRIDRMRAFCRMQGIEPGDRVVLLARNSVDWIAADLGLLAERAAVVPLYTRASVQELVGIVADARPSLILHDDPVLLRAMRAEGLQAPARALSESFEVEALPQEALHKRSLEDLATLIYTSGTSGSSKGVKLSYRNIGASLAVTTRALTALRAAPAPHQERVFHYLPFCFAGSRITLWTALKRGAPLLLSTQLEALRDELRAARPHYVLNVPAVLERIKAGVEETLAEKRLIWGVWAAAQAALDGRDRTRLAALCLAIRQKLLAPLVRRKIGADLCCLISGSAPLAPETQRWFEQLGLPIYQVYGLTETTAIVSMDRPPDAFAGAVGRPVEGCEVRISSQGELQVRGDQVFEGYWNRTDETHEAFDDGWFRTGDLAEQTPDGRLRIVGRMKDIVVPASGHNIAPEPLERALSARVAGIEHVAVIGHGRPFLSAVVSGTATRQEVDRALAEVNEKQPGYRKIRGFFLTTESFSVDNGILTANLKLRRHVLERRFQEEIEQLYAP